jgi:hypothetical protein
MNDEKDAASLGNASTDGNKKTPALLRTKPPYTKPKPPYTKPKTPYTKPKTPYTKPKPVYTPKTSSIGKTGIQDTNGEDNTASSLLNVAVNNGGDSAANTEPDTTADGGANNGVANGGANNGVANGGANNEQVINLLDVGVGGETSDVAVANTEGTNSTGGGAQDITNISAQGTGLTGSQFLAQTSGSSPAEREQAILQAVQAGNMPDFIKHFVEVPLQWNGHEAVIQVAPDYVAIGTNEDFVRIPMAAPTAQRVADSLGCSIPRPKVVDAIWEHAEYKLRPRPLPAGSDMCSNEYFRRANELIDEELGGRPLGALTAGDKKDIVLTNRLRQRPGSVAIYGWQRANGQPIQPLSTVHGASYADYSHGLRLVSSQMTVDGRETTVEEVLADSQLNGLLSNERPVSITRYPNTN